MFEEKISYIKQYVEPVGMSYDLRQQSFKSEAYPSRYNEIVEYFQGRDGKKLFAAEKGYKKEEHLLTIEKRRELFKFMQDRMRVKQQAEASKALEKAENFLKGNKDKNKDILVTKSGLQYRINKKGTGKSPDSSSESSPESSASSSESSSVTAMLGADSSDGLSSIPDDISPPWLFW